MKDYSLQKTKIPEIQYNFEQEITKKNRKYPFNGVASNLIDKFIVLGYEKKSIDNNYRFYEDTDPNIKYKTFFKVFDFIEKPSIINEICNDYSKKLLDNDLILDIIFPNLPKMYFLEKQYMDSENQLMIYL